MINDADTYDLAGPGGRARDVSEFVSQTPSQSVKQEMINIISHDNNNIKLKETKPKKNTLSKQMQSELNKQNTENDEDKEKDRWPPGVGAGSFQSNYDFICV